MFRIWNEFAIDAVNEEVGFFQCSLTKQHSITQNETLLVQWPPLQLHMDGSCHFNFFATAISILRARTEGCVKAELLLNARRNHRAHRACVHDCVNRNTSHVLPRKMACFHKRFIGGIRQLYLDPNFAHFVRIEWNAVR